MKERGTTGAGRPQISGVPRVHVHGHLKRVHSTHGRSTGNDILLGRTSGIRPLISPTKIHGSMVMDGDDVIPTFDGTNFRQYKRRVRLFVSNTRVAPARRAGKLLERLEEYYRTWKHCMVSRICLIT